MDNKGHHICMHHQGVYTFCFYLYRYTKIHSCSEVLKQLFKNLLLFLPLRLLFPLTSPSVWMQVRQFGEKSMESSSIVIVRSGKHA